MPRPRERSVTLGADRRGIALAVAVAALTLLALLVTGLAMLVRRDVRGAGEAVLRARSLALAEEGLAMALRTGLPAADSLAPRGLVRTLVLGTSDAWDTVRVWKTGASTYALVSESGVGAGARRARRRLMVFAIAEPASPHSPDTTGAGAQPGDSAPSAPVRVLHPLPMRAWSALP